MYRGETHDSRQLHRTTKSVALKCRNSLKLDRLLHAARRRARRLPRRSAVQCGIDGAALPRDLRKLRVASASRTIKAGVPSLTLGVRTCALAERHCLPHRHQLHHQTSPSGFHHRSADRAGRPAPPEVGKRGLLVAPVSRSLSQSQLPEASVDWRAMRRRDTGGEADSLLTPLLTLAPDHRRYPAWRRSARS